jgi:hypothetical protein
MGGMAPERDVMGVAKPEGGRADVVRVGMGEEDMGDLCSKSSRAKPRSISSLVSPNSTNVAFPELPLPRMQTPNVMNQFHIGQPKRLVTELMAIIKRGECRRQSCDPS